MRLLVTGASGFLGARVVDRLSDAHDVVVVSRRPLATAGSVPVDLTNPSMLMAARREVGGVDMIVHLAAHVPRSVADDVAGPTYATNVAGTLSLLDAWGDGLSGFVYASTAEVYGLPHAKGPITEAALTAPPTYYAASKLAGEEALRVWSRRSDVPVTSLRLSVLYGAGDRVSRALPNFIARALRDEPIVVGGGEELRDYVHVDDAVDALGLAVARNPDGVFNIGSGHGTAVRDAARCVVERAGSSSPVTIGERTKPPADLVLDITRAADALGYVPRRRFPDRLEEQIAWQRDH